MSEDTPLYLRGINRKRAEEIVHLFRRKYQPPITCLHRGTMSKWKVGGRVVEDEGTTQLPRFLRWRKCSECGWFEGALFKAV